MMLPEQGDHRAAVAMERACAPPSRASPTRAARRTGAHGERGPGLGGAAGRALGALFSGPTARCTGTQAGRGKRRGRGRRRAALRLPPKGRGHSPRLRRRRADGPKGTCSELPRRADGPKGAPGSHASGRVTAASPPTAILMLSLSVPQVRPRSPSRRPRSPRRARPVERRHRQSARGGGRPLENRRELHGLARDEWMAA